MRINWLLIIMFRSPLRDKDAQWTLLYKEAYLSVHWAQHLTRRKGKPHHSAILENWSRSQREKGKGVTVYWACSVVVRLGDYRPGCSSPALLSIHYIFPLL